MEFLDFIRSHLLGLPVLAKFAVGLGIIVGVPPLSRRVRIPDVVGLLLAGVVIGPHGLGMIGEHHPVAEFFAQLGILLLMFFAGLEMDLALFQKAKNKALLFGTLTAGVPLLLGTGVGLLFGYPAVPAIVIGSLLAPHTLVGLPIVTRLGTARLEPATITVGATVVADLVSLIVFAICASTFQSGFSVLSLGFQLLQIALFVPFILFGLSRLGAWLLQRVEGDENAYFVVMLGILTVASLISVSIQLPDIVGAFLAGLAVNTAVQEKPAKGKLEFFGNSLFIPIFFISIGFLIDPVAFAGAIAAKLWFVIAIIIATFLGKGIAAEIVGRAFAYTPAARGTMWSLTLPHVAATLAAGLVATHILNQYGQPLLGPDAINVVLVLVVATTILGPVLTEHFGPGMVLAGSPTDQPRVANGA